MRLSHTRGGPCHTLSTVSGTGKVGESSGRKSTVVSQSPTITGNWWKSNEVETADTDGESFTTVTLMQGLVGWQQPLSPLSIMPICIICVCPEWEQWTRLTPEPIHKMARDRNSEVNMVESRFTGS